MPGTILTSGYNGSAMFLVWAIILAMLLSVYSIACLKLKSPMPLVASCSAAIAAACNLPEHAEKYDIARQALQWVEQDTPLYVSKNDDDVVGHLSFSSKRVEIPMDGVLYAGQVSKQNYSTGRFLVCTFPDVHLLSTFDLNIYVILHLR